jgi:signal transduction histidine kinase
VNVLASHIIEEALRTGRPAGETALVGSGGYYLSRAIPGPGSEVRVASPFPAWLSFAGARAGIDTLASAPGDRVASAFPAAVADRILSAHAGIAAEPGLRGRLVAFAPVFPSREPGAEYWVVVHAVPKAKILASVRRFQVTVLALAAAALGVAVVVGFAAARRFTRPIAELQQAAEAFAHGRFDRPVRVDTGDELEDLARQLGRMAADLGAHSRELRGARERAERRAQEAQALHRIAAEMLALLDLTDILQLVVAKAREILGADLALLVLGAPGGGLHPVAVSGGELEVGGPPPEAPIVEVACEPYGCRGTSCPVLDRYRYSAHASTPLRSEGRGLGYLCVGYRQTREVSPEEREVLQRLGSQAAVAIEKARLQERVRALAALEERERIAADLHDGIIQAVYATGLGVEECRRLLDESPLEARLKLESTVDRLNAVIRDVRNYVVGLPPEALQRRGLGAALEELARDLAVNGLVDAVVEIRPEVEAALSAEERCQLFQAGREALTNVVKHANGARVVFRLARVDGMMRFSVTDDGQGFEPAERMGAGRGLLNLAERARRLGGTLTVESAPGHGTRIAVDVRREGRR